MERSRTGCATCRKRKRKCDEGRPGCRACAARGVECGGYELELRWGNAVASRGHLAGATTPVRPPQAPRSASQHRQRDHPQQQQKAQQQPPQQQHQQQTSDAASQFPSPPQGNAASSSTWGSSPATSTPRGGPEVEPTFEKFLQIGLRRLYASSADDWVESMFRELSIDSLALTTAGVAMQTYVDEGRSQQTLHEITRALRTLREELHERRDVLSAPTMCACLLVCSLQLFEGEPWTKNLKLMTDLYNLGGSLDALQPDPQFDINLRHQLEVLAMMDIPFLVLGRTSPSLGLWTRFRSLQDSWAGGRLKGYEPVSGLSRSLLDLLALSAERQDDAIELELWLWVDEPGQLIQSQHWDAVRHAAILRMRRCRHYASQGASPQDAHSPQSATSPVPQSEIILYRLLSHLEALINGLERPENNGILSTHATLFPMTEASLLVKSLRKHKAWTQPLVRLREHAFSSDGAPPPVATILFELLREAWHTGEDFFDIEKAAQARAVELAIF